MPEAGCGKIPTSPKSHRQGGRTRSLSAIVSNPPLDRARVSPLCRVAGRADPRCRRGMICFPRGHQPQSHTGRITEDDHYSSAMTDRAAGARGRLRGKGRSMHPFRRKPPGDPPSIEAEAGTLGPAPMSESSRTPDWNIVRSVSRHHGTMPPAAGGGGARTSGSDAKRRATPPFKSSGNGRGGQRRSANRPMTATRRLVGRRSIRTDLT